MIIINEAAELKERLQSFRNKDKKIGFVPTMGALHHGHLSLIDASRKGAAITVCSVFVNPAQFNDLKDFEKYPNTIDKDIRFLEDAQTDILFLPSVDEIYPRGFKHLETYPLGYLETILEGRYRPGHFQGVCQVMSRLIKIVMPNLLYMGQKDYQQCMVIRKLIEKMKLEKNISFHVCPTVREADGLAMSSRNLRLSEDERKKAILISQALDYARNAIRQGDLTRLEIEAASLLSSNGFKVDYFEIAKADSLELTNEWDGNSKLVALTAAFLNQVRLIDNMLLN